MLHYTESFEFDRPNNLTGQLFEDFSKVSDVERKLLDYIITNVPKNNPKATIEAIDNFCMQNWMMNFGDQKSKIVISQIKKRQPKNILELGGYCGYSALVFVLHSNAHVHTIQPNKQFIEIAAKIHQHSGITNRITIHQGILSDLREELKKEDTFDLIFIDHIKTLYLEDFKLMEEYDLIAKGSVLVADNIIHPGIPNYLEYFKKCETYKSTLYLSYLAYCDSRDAVLVSEKL